MTRRPVAFTDAQEDRIRAIVRDELDRRVLTGRNWDAILDLVEHHDVDAGLNTLQRQEVVSIVVELNSARERSE